MAKNKNQKYLSDSRINSHFLEEEKRRTLIESAASSLRLAGIKITDKEVKQIVEQTIKKRSLKNNIKKILSSKQLAVLEYLEKVDEATPGEISKKTKVVRPTVNQALDKLLRLKVIERIGLGRGTRYKIL
ncbi:hypothetical protein B6D52_03760 [Candidatus Parcubacteria bacterium 4484_255]|nr:MAG: hypothetical protein B6D52_03760 [Candidatus Parcubacteria bacterium 4484_255]